MNTNKKTMTKHLAIANNKDTSQKSTSTQVSETKTSDVGIRKLLGDAMIKSIRR